MAKYILSQKQKDAYKALVNAMKISPVKETKQKIGENSYSGFEITVFKVKEKYFRGSQNTFASKNANFNKKWKRSWNSIPTLTEIKDMAIKEYDSKLLPIQKRVIVKKEAILKEKDSLMSKYSKVFFKELDKAKKSSKQTKNVKELLAVQSIFEKKVLSFITAAYANTTDEYELKQITQVKEKAIKEIQTLFDKRSPSFSFSLRNISGEDLGYRKDILDMRGHAVQAYNRSFQWCSDKKERAELKEKAENEDFTKTEWYIKYFNNQKFLKSLINTTDFVDLSSIYTYASEIDIYEPQRGDDIHTLNMHTDKYGKISLSWDSAANDSWSYIPKGYFLETNLVVKFNLMYSTNKTKSLITDDRKLKSLYKDLDKLNKELVKIKDKKSLI
jgi:hypothetical protein